MKVIEGCLKDLEIKLKSIAIGDGSADEEEIQKVRDFIMMLTEQSAIIEVEELLSKILGYLKTSKQTQSTSMLKSFFLRHKDRLLR